MSEGPKNIGTRNQIERLNSQKLLLDVDFEAILFLASNLKFTVHDNLPGDEPLVPGVRILCENTDPL